MSTALAVQFLVLWKNHLVVAQMRLWLLTASRVSRSRSRGCRTDQGTGTPGIAETSCTVDKTTKLSRKP